MQNSNININNIEIRTHNLNSSIEGILAKFNFSRIVDYLNANGLFYGQPPATVEELKEKAAVILKHAYASKKDAIYYYNDPNSTTIGGLLATYKSNVLSLSFAICETFSYIEPEVIPEDNVTAIPSDKYTGSPLLSLEI